MTSRKTLLLLALAILASHNVTGVMAHINVTAQRAKELIDTTDGLIILDVRERSEYCGPREHIAGALNYPWNSGVLQARYEEVPMDGPILVVCGSGGRSNAAANFLDAKGFPTVYDMLGGMSVWQWETVLCKYSGGAGTPDDPYQIATAEDLIALGETPEDYDKHFILTADIDLSGYAGTDFRTIGYRRDREDNAPFSGVFDGDGYTISNFTYVSPDADRVGVFGYVDGPEAEIRDLGVIEPNVDAGTGQFVGSLVGELRDGAISGCFVQGGKVSGSEVVGGLVGYANGFGRLRPADSTVVVGCYAITNVIGLQQVGGLVGLNEGTTVSGCYSMGSVSGVGIVAGVGIVGGLVGQNGYWHHAVFEAILIPGFIDDCYSNCDVTGAARVGGLVGFNYAGEITRCYSSGAVVSSEPNQPIDSNDGLFGGLAGSREYGQITNSFWDMEISGQDASDGGTGLTTAEMQMAGTFLESGWDFVGETANGPNDIWKISEGLDYPRLWWEKYGGGMGEPNDPYLIYAAEHLNELRGEPNDWDKHFRLMADIDMTGYVYAYALIAPDLDPNDPAFQGTSFTGVFDGDGHAISNLTIDGAGYLGLFGRLDSGAEVANLKLLDVSITGVDYVAGLVGFNSGHIGACGVTGEITGNQRVGGLTARNWGDIAASSTAGSVTGLHDVGGLAGANYGTIATSYSTAAVSGNKDVGGLVAENYGSIDAGYSTGTVAADINPGGLAAYNWPDTGTISGFWDVEASGLATSDGGTGKTTAEMQTVSIFLDAGWDFAGETANGTEDIWWILEGKDYPRLWWQTNSN